MKRIGLFVIVMVVTVGYTQAPDTLWTKTYGGTGDDVGNSIKQTSDGGYIIAGYTESIGAGGQDVWLLKTDANGDTVWTKTYGGSQNEWAEYVEQTIDGGYVIAAIVDSFGWGGACLIKTDSLGNVMWTQIYGGWCPEVHQTSDGGYITVNSGGLPPWYGCLIKTDTNGDTIWTSDVFCARGYSVHQTFDGGYAVAGDVWGGQGTTAAWLAKLNSLGDTVWCIVPPFPSPPAQNARFLSVKQTVDSGYIACGLRIWADYSCHLCIIKTDLQGDTLWTRQYGDSLTFFEWYAANSLQLTNDNGYILTGGRDTSCTQVGDLVLFKIDENGDSLWLMVCGGVSDEEGLEVQQTSDGGYIVVGYTESYGAGGSDVWIIKTEPDVGIEENEPSIAANKGISASIFRGPLQLPEGKKCNVYDITGRVVEPNKIGPGIYFLEIDNEIVQKVIRIR